MQEREPKTRFVAVEELRKQLELASEDSDTGLFEPAVPSPQRRPAQPSRSDRTATVVEALGAAGMRAQAARKSARTQVSREEPMNEPKRAAEPVRLPAVRSEGVPPSVSPVQRLLNNRMVASAGLASAALLAVIATAALSSSDGARDAAPTYAQAGVAPLVAASAHEQQAETRAQGRQADIDEPSTTNEGYLPGPPAGGGRERGLVVAPPACEQARPNARTNSKVAQGVSEENGELELPEAVNARGAVDLLLAGRRREALDAYRALSMEPGAPPELSVVAVLLERELRDCAPGDESCVH